MESLNTINFYFIQKAVKPIYLCRNAQYVYAEVSDDYKWLYLGKLDINDLSDMLQVPPKKDGKWNH